MSGFRRGRGGFGPKAGFRQQQKEPATGVHPALLKNARKSGQLNLSNRQLSEVPDSVWRINTDVPEEGKNVSLDTSNDDRWWDQVDLSKLILASNTLTAISPQITQLPALSVLDVHDNQLESLPDALAELSNLQRLNVSHNRLTGLPDNIARLRGLLSLHAQHNQIQELPEEFGKLYDLEELDMSHNQIRHLPRSVCYLNRVTKLNVAENSLSVLPPEIGAMNNLRVLDATHNELHTLPDEIGSLCYLEQLYLRHNRLTHLPILTDCKNLKELHAGNNNIRGLPVEQLECMAHVSVLDIRDNRIEKIPLEILLLKDLERLDLTNNDISVLPFEMGNMTKLKSLVLEGNPMKGIRRDIVRRGTMELKKYLASRIEEEPEQVDGPAKGVKVTQGTSGIIGGGEGIDTHAVAVTKTLDYSNKQASDVPADVWELAQQKEIHTVNFSKNTFTDIPSNLVLTAASLQHLNMGFNRLTSLNPDISLFLKLAVLDLRNNQLSDLPPGMNVLQSLLELTLSCNRFSQIPDVVYELKGLEVLMLNDNKVGHIDASKIQKLDRLRSLDLQNNDIMQVPPELGNCESIKSLLIAGNPFRIPRPAILTKGTVFIMEWLRDRIPK